MLGSVTDFFIHCLDFQIEKLLLKLVEQMLLESSFRFKEIPLKISLRAKKQHMQLY